MILNKPCQLFLYFLFIPAFASAIDTLGVNQSLSGNQTLVSLDERFEMGFFKAGNSSNYYIGIWYKTIYEQTVVWVANRNKPIYDTFSSQLKIINGNLVLLDDSNTQIWSTNMTTNATPASSVVLLDDGNLVLRYGSNSSVTIWQSFDHPTDTFLPGMKLGYNKRTNTKQVFTSWKSIDNPAVGLFSFEIDQNQKQFVLKWNRSVQYWASGSWNEVDNIFRSIPEMRLKNIYDFSYVDNENESYITYSLYNRSIMRRYVTDGLGQIQQLAWSSTAEQWILFWAQPRDVCQVYGRCGAFGVCNTQGLPFCKCLTGFESRSQSDWNLYEVSGGCVRKTELSCKIKKPMMFVLSYVETSFLSGFPRNEAGEFDELECKSSCLNYCPCSAYTFISNTCKQWNQEELDSISLVLTQSSYTYKSTKFTSKFHRLIIAKAIPKC